MTDFNAWDRKAAKLVDDMEEEDQKETEENNKALGITGEPEGPPVQKAKEQRAEMEDHGEKRTEFINEMNSKEEEVTFSAGSSSSREPIVVMSDGGEGPCKSKVFKDCTGVDIVLPAEAIFAKLMFIGCTDVKVEVRCKLMTSSIEAYKCQDLEVHMAVPLGTLQCDACRAGPVRFLFDDPEQIGILVHCDCPALEVGIGSSAPQKIGAEGECQYVTRLAGGELSTEVLYRGEGKFPVNLQESAYLPEPVSEADAQAESLRDAEQKRQEGNSAFRANDFMQAALHYSEALLLNPSLHIALANRAQCYLKTGQPEKALEDATKCTEMAPDYAKGWFRKGMALHMQEKYRLAIPPLVEAEKLDPANKQIQEAIKFAQLMCRNKGPGDEDS